MNWGGGAGDCKPCPRRLIPALQLLSLLRAVPRLTPMALNLWNADQAVYELDHGMVHFCPCDRDRDERLEELCGKTHQERDPQKFGEFLIELNQFLA